MMDRMIRQSKMKTLRIMWAGVDGIINMKFITEYLHQGGYASETNSLALSSSDHSQGASLHVYLNTSMSLD